MEDGVSSRRLTIVFRPETQWLSGDLHAEDLMKLTKIKPQKINSRIINKLVILTTGFCVSFVGLQTNFIPSTMAAQKTSRINKVSDLSVVVNSQDKQILLARRLCKFYRVTRRYGLYVYRGDKVVDTIPYNTIVIVTQISSDGSWALVYYEGGSGWVAARYLACYQR